MRRLILVVAAAAVRAEYFDVEEDAFWENDGPQEPRKTVKPKTTAPRIAKTACVLIPFDNETPFVLP